LGLVVSLAGAWLIAWPLVFRGGPAHVWNLRVCGGVLVVLGLIATLHRPRPGAARTDWAARASWAAVLLGLWVWVWPWIFAARTNYPGLWTAAAGGLLASAAAACSAALRDRSAAGE
jgi:hypothetical protein